MNVKPRFLLLFMCVVILSCHEDVITYYQDVEKTKDNKLFVQNEKLDPGGIIQVDNYPLFIMNYERVYNFREYINTRNSTINNSINSSSPLKWGCSCFSAFSGKSKFFGRNFDYYHHAALILYTRPAEGYRSISVVDLFYLGFSETSTLEQVRQSTSITGSPYCPFDGINEKGVTIGFMSVPKAEPPFDSNKKSLTSVEIVRLILDYASSTDEAVQLIRQYNYRVNGEKVHFMIADKTGKSAVIEFVNGEVKVIYNNEPFQVSTNFIITGSQVSQSTSCWRYNKAYIELKNRNGNSDESIAMNILNSISQSITMWSAVYNLDSLSLNISVERKYDKIYKIKMDK